MSQGYVILGSLGAIAVLLALVLAWLIRRRNLQYWLGSYLVQSARRRFTRPPATRDVHVLLCIADHFEPAGGGASEEVADARVAAWVGNYPRLFGEFRDSDGRPPQHTFFFPIDEYQPGRVDALSQLCRAGFGEIEIHLHHHNDTAANLEATLRKFTKLFAERHGLLGKTPDGQIAYGFVHGNWALDNSRPDGRCCGVRNELDVLQRTGCYADFTMPSAPDVTQTSKINSIYYAFGDPDGCKSHDRGVDVGTAVAPPSSALMLIQGPLVLARSGGRWVPGIENGCLQLSQPPTLERLDRWLRAGVRVPQRPDWSFVKLHTHGATETNQKVLLGDAMVDFHRGLAARVAKDPRFHVHYVTARELHNLAKAAEAGWSGEVAGARDYRVTCPGHVKAE
jgi:hypothetical protein